MIVNPLRAIQAVVIHRLSQSGIINIIIILSCVCPVILYDEKNPAETYRAVF